MDTTQYIIHTVPGHGKCSMTGANGWVERYWVRQGGSGCVPSERCMPALCFSHLTSRGYSEDYLS